MCPEKIKTVGDESITVDNERADVKTAHLVPPKLVKAHPTPGGASLSSQPHIRLCI